MSFFCSKMSIICSLDRPFLSSERTSKDHGMARHGTGERGVSVVSVQKGWVAW